MVPRFQVVRHLLGVIIALTAVISVSLGAILAKYFLRRGIAWLLVSVEICSIIRSIWSAIRKPVFASPQPVASEAIGLFVLFPFQLIIVLVMSSISPKHGVHALEFLVLRVFVVTSSVLHLTYTVALIAVAALTVPAFDGDVWMRDIDSTPSPFPLPIIFAFFCPCIARRFSATRLLVPQPTPHEPPPNVCLPSCQPNCCFHGDLSFGPKPTIAQTENNPNASSEHPPKEPELMRKPPILPHTLVRVPNAAERRASIYLALPIRSL
ncbi:hypothetical protein GALMADRAFT_249263 [Galerina marginata CBS 339.88]|uniref:Uncharacterized protein n=1 Tax=Galerina marginata (strain CBS 339.88) TaxID=685588 RepID=A0A067SWI7_GALM3|nr:hypothetical protein GALMADRAFT_249263 [Galerina marginata CBS 339.88]